MSDCKLMLGDCLERMKEIPDGSVDLVLTDIPYNEVNRLSSGLRNLNKDKADILLFNLEESLSECVRICTGSIYIFCGIEQISFIRSYFVERKLSTRLCIWEKSNPSPMNGTRLWLSGIESIVFARKPKATFNEHCKNTVFRFPTVRGKLHPTMKPILLIEKLIKASSNEGDTVLDFTMGSGTTGVACKNLNRNFIGIELDEKYFEIAKKRIKETGVTQ